MQKIDTVMAFYGAWANNDIDGSLALCTEDLVWDAVPLKPFEGKEKVRSFLEKFAVGMSDQRYDIKNTLEDGDLLMIEGVENYKKNGHQVSIPYMAIFRFQGDKISEMRDYFDLKTVEQQLGLTN